MWLIKVVKEELESFWAVPAADLLSGLETTEKGLTSVEAQARLARFGPNSLRPTKRFTSLSLLLGQFKSPITIILMFATVLAFFLGDAVDAAIILVIILASGLLGFWQERGATNAVAKLLAIVQIRSTVLRDGQAINVRVEDIVPGDIVQLNAGDVIPGDCLALDSRDLFVDEASLTGETFPVEKKEGILPAETPLSQRANSLYMGTHVVSGTAMAAVVKTGTSTEFGKISDRLKLRPPETEFEQGVRHFGYLLMEVTLILVIAIFAINVFFKRPVLEALLFALALAVGLTPQLLPAIISINLSHGASRMARKKVIVKRLASIENFGSMNILCADKTGTLTEGTIHLHGAIDVSGKDSAKVLLLAYLNSVFEAGFSNPIDEAIRSVHNQDIAGYSKLDEVPYDFNRKRLSILVSKSGVSTIITKGAVENILDVCSTVENVKGEVQDIGPALNDIKRRYQELSTTGYRTLGLAYKPADGGTVINQSNEKDMTFLGFLVFHDPLKESIAQTVDELKRVGVTLKIITGDNRYVAAHVGQQVGFSASCLLTGPEISRMSPEALIRRVNDIDIFAQIEPSQKERIVSSLKKAGNVVGFIGDGINDAPALHAADVSISVEGAVDVAKQAADIVLMEKDLSVLKDGVKEGRMTFANTLKYVFMATSANFGNMFSMAGASLIMPFLPLLPKQILLTNFLTDLPEMTIANDNVDVEQIEKPRRWDLRFIRNFMITFGLLSSVFDFATFGVLLLLLNATPEQFRAGWFIESVVSAALIVMVVRTRRFFLKSTPGRALLITTLLVVLAVLILPYTGLGLLFGFAPLPVYFLAFVGLIVIVYAGSAEIAKRIFYRRLGLMK